MTIKQIQESINKIDKILNETILSKPERSVKEKGIDLLNRYLYIAQTVYDAESIEISYNITKDGYVDGVQIAALTTATNLPFIMANPKDKLTAKEFGNSIIKMGFTPFNGPTDFDITSTILWSDTPRHIFNRLKQRDWEKIFAKNKWKVTKG